MNLIERIKNSTPTLTEGVIDLVIAHAIDDHNVIFVNTILPYEEVEYLCELFIDQFACIKVDDELVVSRQPVHVLYTEAPTEHAIWGLLYSNGLVTYSEHQTDPSEYRLSLFAEKSFADFIGAKYKTVQEIIEDNTNE